MRQWNGGQLEGIRADAANILMSASAGTGKTAVLVERLIGKLCDPLRPLGMDRFIFVTFTNAAAREMARRVRQGIEERVRLEPENRRLARQQKLLGQAEISTLHGFCLELIRRHDKELGIDPQSRVLSEPEQILLKEEILEAFLEECYAGAGAGAGFAALDAAYGGDGSDMALKRLVFRVFDFAAAQPGPLCWLEHCVDLYKEENGAEKLVPFLKKEIGDSLRGLAGELDYGVALAERLPALEKYAHCLRTDREKLLALGAEEDWAVLVRAMEGAGEVFGRLPTVQQKMRANEGPEAYTKRLVLQPGIKEIRESCKKEFRRLASGFAGETEERLNAEIGAMAPAMLALASLTAGFYRRYQMVKKERALLDFGDIEHYAAELLFDGAGRPTALAKTLRERYEEILVDEYQDINPVQEAILQALRGKRLVMVGDVKQSIYGFRQAAPRLFLEKYRRYQGAEAGESAGKNAVADDIADAAADGGIDGGEDGKLVTLAESYRGSQWVIEGVNQVFAACMTAETCGVDYRSEGMFSCAFPLPEEARPRTDPRLGRGPLELHLIDLSGGQTGAAAMTAAETGNEEVSGEGVFADDAPGMDEDAGGEGFGDGYGDMPGGAYGGVYGDAHGDVHGDAPEDARENLPEPEVLQAEAAFCAGRIEGLAGEELWDRVSAERRPVMYRDIVILLPAMKGVAEVFVRALRERNIPVYADIGGGYFQAQEIQTALSFLKVLDNPRQDIPLAALMLSPAFGFGPETLGAIRTVYMDALRARGSRRAGAGVPVAAEIGSGDIAEAGVVKAEAGSEAGTGHEAGAAPGAGGKWGGLYKALVYAAAREKTAGVYGLRPFLRMLKACRLFARQASIADVLMRFYEETGFLTMAAAMAGGAQRRANLLALLDRAEEFEDTGLRGLYPFIQYVETLEKRKADLAPAPVVGEGEDAVRIMSIHKSKGLEFPVVILATAGRRFFREESRNDLLLHETLGMAGKIILTERRVKYDGACHRLSASRIRREQIAERQRLLYVALTRAEQRLIVLSADKKGEKRYRGWQGEGGLRKTDAGLKAQSFMDWLGPAVVGASGPSCWVSRLWPAEMAATAVSAGADAGEGRGEKLLWQVLVSGGETGPAEKGGDWAYIGEQMDWRYPWEAETGLPAKLSVTQARGRLYPDEDPEAAEAEWRKGIYRPHPEGPKFLQKSKTQTPAEKGILLHRILAGLRPYDAMLAMEREKAEGKSGREAAEAYFSQWSERLLAGGFLTPWEKETAEAALLIPFLESGLFRRMALADARGDCRLEASFTMLAPAYRVYPDRLSAPGDGISVPGDSVTVSEDSVTVSEDSVTVSEDSIYAPEERAPAPGETLSAKESRPAARETVVVQGTIDAFFDEGDGLVLVDYKSDRIRPGEEEALLRRYGGQLRLYAEGLEAFSGKKVKEMLLFSLQLGKEIRLSFSPQDFFQRGEALGEVRDRGFDGGGAG